MKIKCLVGILIILILVVGVKADHNTTYVNSSTDVQLAIDNASAGDTLIFRDGVYTEKINVTKRLTIKSENGSAHCSISVDSGNPVTLNADGIKFQGFSISSSNSSSDSCFGIFLRSNNNTVLNNNISGSSCTGLAILYTDNNTLSNNSITNNYNGIFLRDSQQNIIKNNRLVNNSNQDIQISIGNNNTFTNNTLGVYPTTVSFTYRGNFSLKGVSSPPLDPSGYHNISKYVNVTNDGSSDGWVFLNFSYSDSDISNFDEETLKVWKYNGSWAENGWSSNRSLDMNNNLVGANITSFSTFAPLGTNFTSATVTELQNTTGNFWINWTWGNPDLDHNHTEIWINDKWKENTTNNYYNLSALQPHNTSTISLRPVDEYGNKGEWTNQTITVPNNPINLTNVSHSYTLQEGNLLYIDANCTDLDSDTGNYYTNATKGSLDPATGVFTWTPGGDDAGKYRWNITVTDGYGSSDTLVFDVMVNDAVVVISNLQSDTENNFWVNYIWNSTNCSSFNISYNGVWHNETTSEFYGENLSAHTWGNMTVYGYNASLGTLSLPLSAHTRFPNNPITLTDVSGLYTLLEGEELIIDANATDVDSDVPIFYTNASQGSINSSTGVFSWKTGTDDSGQYLWNITVTDGYGSSATSVFAVTVNDATPTLPHSITVVEKTNSSINWTWVKGNNSDYTVVYVNGIWKENSVDNYYEHNGIGHTAYEIQLREHNSTLNENSTWANQTNTTHNSPIKIYNISSSYPIVEGDTLYINAEYTDPDGDTGTFATNATEGTFYNTTGEFTWNTVKGDAGTYHWQINVSDGYGSTAEYGFTVMVSSVPSPQNLEAATGEFYVNWSWGYAEGIDSFNYTKPDGSWINNSINTSSNFTVGPHGFYNITVFGYNASKHNLSNPVTGTYQVPNNPPLMDDIPDQTVDEGQEVYVDVSAGDADEDTLTYSCNRTDLFTDFNSTSGEGNWTTSSDSAGTYYVEFGVSDGYGGVDNSTVKIVVKEETSQNSFSSSGGGGGGTLGIFSLSSEPTPTPNRTKEFNDTSTESLVSTPGVPGASPTPEFDSGPNASVTPLSTPIRIIVVDIVEEEKNVKEVFNQTSYVKFEYETVIQKVIIVFPQGNETGYRVIHRMTILESNATANSELWALLNVSKEVAYSADRMIFPQSHKVMQENPIIGLELNTEVGNEGELNVTVVTGVSESKFVNGIEITHLLILNESGGFSLPPTLIILLLAALIAAIAVYYSLRGREKQ